MAIISKLYEFVSYLKCPGIRIDYWYDKYADQEYIELIDWTRVENQDILTIKIFKTLGKNISWDNTTFEKIMMDVVELTDDTGRLQMLDYLSTIKISKWKLRKIKKHFEEIQKCYPRELKECEYKSGNRTYDLDENSSNSTMIDDEDVPAFFK